LSSQPSVAPAIKQCRLAALFRTAGWGGKRGRESVNPGAPFRCPTIALTDLTIPGESCAAYFSLLAPRLITLHA
jgi:hypothetical protein